MPCTLAEAQAVLELLPHCPDFAELPLNQFLECMAQGASPILTGPDLAATLFGPDPGEEVEEAVLNGDLQGSVVTTRGRLLTTSLQDFWQSPESEWSGERALDLSLPDNIGTVYHPDLPYEWLHPRSPANLLSYAGGPPRSTAHYVQPTMARSLTNGTAKRARNSPYDHGPVRPPLVFTTEPVPRGRSSQPAKAHTHMLPAFAWGFEMSPGLLGSVLANCGPGTLTVVVLDALHPGQPVRGSSGGSWNGVAADLTLGVQALRQHLLQCGQPDVFAMDSPELCSGWPVDPVAIVQAAQSASIPVHIAVVPAGSTLILHPCSGSVCYVGDLLSRQKPFSALPSVHLTSRFWVSPTPLFPFQALLRSWRKRPILWVPTVLLAALQAQPPPLGLNTVIAYCVGLYYQTTQHLAILANHGFRVGKAPSIPPTHCSTCNAVVWNVRCFLGTLPLCAPCTLR
eukprot:NODE_680_length_1430_cov_40.100652_g509_i0.p1 GENE.NODE_680_length_1430_cov_40.100652_g509_i0~~NODE_680_length_1430_cov_40.100652_g509_i0.p1  ORF type:complete len:476 (-),score=90.14 NODE_680_length_1430_cov_40.100652_g509_i0:3-1367(-)